MGSLRHVIRRLDGLLQGDYRTLFYGFGVDFADLREYQPEDDVRYIDWNVTARMGVPIEAARCRYSAPRDGSLPYDSHERRTGA